MQFLYFAKSRKPRCLPKVAGKLFESPSNNNTQCKENRVLKKYVTKILSLDLLLLLCQNILISHRFNPKFD
jgi:hypothetical protein